MESNGADRLVIANYALWSGDYVGAHSLLEEFLNDKKRASETFPWVFDVAAQTLLERINKVEKADADNPVEEGDLTVEWFASEEEERPLVETKKLTSANGALNAVSYYDSPRDFTMRGYVSDLEGLLEAKQKLEVIGKEAGWKNDFEKEETADYQTWIWHADNAFLTIQFDVWGLLIVHLKWLTEEDRSLVEGYFATVLEKVSEALPPYKASDKN